VKALSVRQPWAELILQGRKSIELRTWGTNYRGLLAVHAGQEVNPEACAVFALRPSTLARGAVLGTVRVVEMVPLDQEAWAALREQHLALGPYRSGLVGWRLADPQRLPQPVVLPGRMGLFDVPDELLAGVGKAGSAAGRPTGPGPVRRSQGKARYCLPQDLEHDPGKPFELCVVPAANGRYGLALYQWPLLGTGRPEAPGAAVAPATPAPPQLLVQLQGDTLRAVVDQVLEALRRAGYRATDLSAERQSPFLLDEETGLRLGLLFLAVKPLTRLSRIEAVSLGLRVMPSEEAYYWFSKCTALASARKARRALRVLLGGE